MKSLHLAATLLVATLAATAQTTVSKSPYGKLTDGAQVDSYTLTDKTLTVRIITFGAHVISVKAPDTKGNIADVVLGYDSLAGYVADDKTYVGSVVGRYGNRIGKGQFTLDGKKVQLDLNNNGNTLHGGKLGFDRKNWTGKQIPNGVELTLVSPDGDMGFPGTLTAHVKYSLERRQAAHGLHRDHGQADGRQPDPAQLLQPRRTWRYPGPHPDDRRRSIHAGRPWTDPARTARTCGRHALRLPEAHGGRSAHKHAERAVEARRRLRPQLWF